jgi:hypothetical protein
MKKLTILAALILLAACNSNKSGAEDAVRAVLKDPDSAKFGEFYYNEKTQKGCLTVNAKNSMGGYTGDQQAYIEKTDKGWDSFEIGDVSAAMCREIYADVKK